MGKVYIAIDLKSFYASVECVELGLDPLTTNLVVADKSRTEKTICLAVSPSLKAYGISGRARLFEVVQKIKEVNLIRDRKTRENGSFRNETKTKGKSFDDNELKDNPELAVDYIVVPPRMSYYMRYSARIYSIYLRYVAPEDIYVYSIDEVFIDATPYLKMYGVSAEELTRKILKEVLAEIGITATAGIGTNLYLAKVAMDIIAKHEEADENGVRIAELDEMKYREILWGHRPLTDFWRIGRGYARRLEQNGLYTMGDIALCSERDEDFLYRLFGVNAELLIDHAWGYEPCEISDIKKYKPKNNSFSSGQVLKEPYDFKKARVVVREMAEEMAFSLLDKKLTTSQVVLTVEYDKVSLLGYKGEVMRDFYGREVPKHTHGTKNLEQRTASSGAIREAVTELFDELVNRDLMVRRITIEVQHVLPEDAEVEDSRLEQLDLFTDYEEKARDKQKKIERIAKEKQTDRAILSIKKRYGKNAILKGINFEEGATGRERNVQIGGHRG